MFENGWAEGEGIRKKIDDPEVRLLMQLALKMGRTIQDLYESMSAYEFSLWAAEYARNPWGEERQDYRAGIVASTVANMSGKTLKRGNESKPRDFMPFQTKTEDEEFINVDPATFLKSVGHG